VQTRRRKKRGRKDLARKAKLAKKLRNQNAKTAGAGSAKTP
jgi:hypothetical protein